MVISMTGYGRGQQHDEQFSVTIEIKTVNHRFKEYYMRLPKQFLIIEDKIKKQLDNHIQRGRIEVHALVEGQGSISRKVQVDWELLADYYKKLEEIRSAYHAAGDITLESLLKSELITIEEKEMSSESLNTLLLEAVKEACGQLVHMRNTEGAKLQEELRMLLKQLQLAVTKIMTLAPSAVEKYKQRIRKKIQELLDGQIDETRIMMEAAIFADKCDISEELARLNSHIAQYENTLQTTGPVGRKLDFLIQEMNREANTIGSKANEANIASQVVEMKSILEKMKEQVQNIE